MLESVWKSFIVVYIKASAGTIQIVTMVEPVSEVLNIKGENIEHILILGIKLKNDNILGMAKMEGGV